MTRLDFARRITALTLEDSYTRAVEYSVNEESMEVSQDGSMALTTSASTHVT